MSTHRFTVGSTATGAIESAAPAVTPGLGGAVSSDVGVGVGASAVPPSTPRSAQLFDAVKQGQLFNSLDTLFVSTESVTMTLVRGHAAVR